MKIKTPLSYETLSLAYYISHKINNGNIHITLEEKGKFGLHNDTIPFIFSFILRLC